MTKVSRSIIINSPIEKVFDVVSNFAVYPEFLPETKNVTIEKKTPTEVVAEFTLKVMTNIRYTLKLKLKRPSSITWNLVEGQMMKHNDGSWKFKKLAGGKTQAVYSIDVGFGLFVPKGISDLLVDSNLPTMLSNFKKRIESKN